MRYDQKLEYLYRLERRRNDWHRAGSQLQLIENEIVMLREKRASAAGQALDGMPRSQTMRDSLADYAARVIELEGKAEAMRANVRKKYIAVIVEEKRFFDAVGQSPEAELLMSRIMLGRSFSSLSKIFNCPETTIRRRFQKAVENLTDEDMRPYTCT